MSRLTTVNSNYFEASNLNGTVVKSQLYFYREELADLLVVV